MLVNASEEKLNFLAPNFNLLSTNNKYYKLADLKGINGTVIAFICNHCPYVIKIIERLVFESYQLKKIGVSTIAIMPNDVFSYPEDSFENMKLFAKKYKFNFQYLYDQNQEVAKSYKAVCTPDIFGFNKDNILQYRGRIDSGVTSNDNKNINRELFYAMKLIAYKNHGPSNQSNSFGCSIKWLQNE